MPYSSTSAAATSSWVERVRGAEHHVGATRLERANEFAVSVVTWRQAETRCPASGCSRSKRSRIAASTGICRSAHWMRRTPSEASARSFTSCRCVVAIRSSLRRVPGVRSGCGRPGGEQALVLALLPLDQAGAAVSAAGTFVPASQVSTARRSSGSRRSRIANASSSSSTPKPARRSPSARSWFSSRMP